MENIDISYDHHMLHVKNTLNHTNIYKLVDIIESNKSNEFNILFLGRQRYDVILKLQNILHHGVQQNSINDVVLLLEHDHVFTLGKNANSNHIINNPLNIDVFNTDRGGDVTYHGPGQLIGYPIINLNNFKKSISWYMRSLENIIIKLLKVYKIDAVRKSDYPGVWVNDKKICAMGVRISKWVTMHGFALNINPNMQYFKCLIPCGIFQYQVTSIENEIKLNIDFFNLINNFISEFSSSFQHKIYEY